MQKRGCVGVRVGVGVGYCTIWYDTIKKTYLWRHDTTLHKANHGAHLHPCLRWHLLDKT
jgi:hypothetical protein